MPDGRDRKRTHSPVAVPVSPSEAGKMAARINELGYKHEAILDRVSRLEGMIREGDQSATRTKGEHYQQINNLRSEVSEVKGATRELSTIKKLGFSMAGVLLPILIYGAVFAIQSMTKQETAQIDIDKNRVRTIAVETRMSKIEKDFGIIKTKQDHSIEAIQVVSKKLDEMKESQDRVERRMRIRR